MSAQNKNGKLEKSWGGRVLCDNFLDNILPLGPLRGLVEILDVADERRGELLLGVVGNVHSIPKEKTTLHCLIFIPIAHLAIYPFLATVSRIRIHKS